MKGVFVQTVDDARRVIFGLGALPTVCWPVFEGQTIVSFNITTREQCVTIPLHHPVLPNADPRVLHAIGEWASGLGQGTWVPTMRDVARLRHRWGVPITPGGDLELAERFSGVNFGSQPLQDIETLFARMDEFYGWLRSPARRACWQVELQTALALAQQSELGYLTPDGVQYPRWTTIHPSGSGRISCAKPNIPGTRLADRSRWRAPDGCLWVELRMPEAEWRMLAALTGDPWVLAALDGEGPAAHVRDLLKLSTSVEVSAVMGCLLHFPFSPDYYVAKVGVSRETALTWVRRLGDVAPHWAAWVTETYNAQEHTSWMDRPIDWHRTQPVDAMKIVLTAKIQQSVATLLKTVLVALVQKLQLGVPAYHGIENVIPLAEAVLYTAPSLNLEAHVRSATTMPGLLRTINDVPFPLVVRVGETWGSLEPYELPEEVMVEWGSSSTMPSGTDRS